MKHPLKIAISFDYHFSIRDFLFTPVWEEMAAHQESHFYLISSHPAVQALVMSRGCNNISFVTPQSVRKRTILRRILEFSKKNWRPLFDVLDDRYVFDSLMYRFVAVNHLAHYQIRRKKSPSEKKRQQVFLNYRKGDWPGEPFPESRLLFRLLYYFRHGALNVPSPAYIAFVQDLAPDVFVFGRLHWLTTARWSRVMRQFGIPMIGLVASWDHPTVQGPTPRGMSSYVVASKRMAEEMRDLHGIDAQKIVQVGKVQMDLYQRSGHLLTRANFFEQLNIPLDHKLVTLGTNTDALRDHEVSIARKLAQDFKNGVYGKATLFIRTHPQDLDWQRDFQSLQAAPAVICMAGASFGYRPSDEFSRGAEDQFFLANLMKHSDIVIQTRGSLAFDAIAFDRPVISLAFDGDLNRPTNDSIVWEYCYEHYKPVVTSGGTWLVGSYKALDRAIQAYLADPSIHASGRSAIRAEHLEPLDGQASKRLVDHLVTFAAQARNGCAPEGDWDYTGLGDTTWSARQRCDIHNFLDV